ncbi:hypothetical protein ABK040_001414 [Willaertia magna]
MVLFNNNQRNSNNNKNNKNNKKGNDDNISSNDNNRDSMDSLTLSSSISTTSNDNNNNTITFYIQENYKPSIVTINNNNNNSKINNRSTTIDHLNSIHYFNNSNVINSFVNNNSINSNLNNYSINEKEIKKKMIEIKFLNCLKRKDLNQLKLILTTNGHFLLEQESFYSINSINTINTTNTMYNNDNNTINNQQQHLLETIPIEKKNILHLAIIYGITENYHNNTVDNTTDNNVDNTFSEDDNYSSDDIHIDLTICLFILNLLKINYSIEYFEKLSCQQDENNLIPFHYILFKKNIYFIFEIFFSKINVNFIKLKSNKINNYINENNIELCNINNKNLKLNLFHFIVKCCKKDKISFIQLLIKLGIDLYQPIEFKNNFTILHISVKYNSIYILQYLLQEGIFIDLNYFSKNYQNWTPLCEAVLNLQKEEMIPLLIYKNADINRKFKNLNLFGNFNLNLLSLSCYLCDFELFYFFEQKINFVNSNCLFYAIKGICSLQNNLQNSLQNFEFLEMLQSEPYLLTFKKERGENNKNCLHIAVENLNFKIIKYLKLNNELLINEKDKDGNIPLHLLLMKMNKEFYNDNNCNDNNCNNSCCDTIDNNNCDNKVNDKNKINSEKLELYRNIVKYLVIDCKCDFTILNNKNKSCIDLAIDKEIILLFHEQLTTKMEIYQSTIMNDNNKLKENEIFKLLTNKIEVLERTMQQQDLLLKECFKRIEYLENKK